MLEKYFTNSRGSTVYTECRNLGLTLLDFVTACVFSFKVLSFWILLLLIGFSFVWLVEPLPNYKLSRDSLW